MAVKRAILIIGLFISCFSALAQTTDSLLSDFNNSFIRQFNYPNELVNNCVATQTVLKIEIAANGTISSMKLSDSADPLFLIEWLAKSPQMDISSLKKYIKSRDFLI